MTAIAMVANDAWGRPIAAVSCSAVSDRLLPDKRPAIVAMLRQEVERIEARLRPAVEAKQTPHSSTAADVIPRKAFEWSRSRIGGGFFLRGISIFWLS
jgi:hypothetical protein